MLDRFKILQEILVFIRNRDILSISTRKVSTTTDNFTATLSQTTFTLSQLKVKNVRSATKNTVPLTFGSQYTVNYQTGIVTIPSAVLNDAIVITYDYGTYDRIFPDFPQSFLTRSDFPRIGMGFTNETTRELSIGAQGQISEAYVDIIYYAESREEIDQNLSTLRNAFLSNKKNWYNIDFITIAGYGPILQSTFGEQRIYQRNLILRLPAMLEA